MKVEHSFDKLLELLEKHKTTPADTTLIEQYSYKNETIKALGISGAMWGAAMNIALSLYRRGPIVALSDPAIKDRLIMVCRKFT